MNNSIVSENLKRVQYNIAEAKAKYRNENDDVRLMAVTKTVPYEIVNSVIEQGVDLLGENRVQEYLDKKDHYDKNAEVHFIGHLQTNKVKYIIDSVKCIHSVDSLKLAEEIQKQAAKHDVTADILVEVNIANEESKFGISKDETIQMVRDIAKLDHLKIKGLMTIAPFVENPEDNRLYFREIKQLSVDINNQNIDNVSMDVLSMGMTGDYMVAIEEGATMVRVGTGIFGERNYNI